MDWDTIGSWIWGSILIVIAAVVWWIGPSVVWYSFKYKVPTDKVEIAPEPTDCDFWHAPVGFKGCHYERSVVAVQAGGSTADCAPTGDKDWLCPADKQDRNVKYDFVFVSWTKESD